MLLQVVKGSARGCPPPVRVARLLVEQFPGDRLVYAFTRAGSSPNYWLGGGTKISMQMVHKELCRAGDSIKREHFYSTWASEHANCRGQEVGECPIPDFHSWACQMQGERSSFARRNRTPAPVSDPIEIDSDVAESEGGSE